MIIVIFNSRKIKLVKERQCILQVDIVVGYTVHDEEANIALEGSRVAYARVGVALRIVLGSEHVALCVNGIYQLI